MKCAFHTVNQTDEWRLCPFVSDRDFSAMNNTHRFCSICVPQRKAVFVCVRVHVRDCVCVCFFGRGINEDEDRRHCLLCLCVRVGRCVWGVSALHESLKRNWGPRRHTWRLSAEQCVPSKQRTALFAENTLCICIFAARVAVRMTFSKYYTVVSAFPVTLDAG